MSKSLYSSKHYMVKKTNKLLLVRKKTETGNTGSHRKKKLYIRLVVLWGHYPEQHGHGTNHYEYTNNSIAKLDTQTS